MLDPNADLHFADLECQILNFPLMCLDMVVLSTLPNSTTMVGLTHQSNGMLAYKYILQMMVHYTHSEEIIMVVWHKRRSRCSHPHLSHRYSILSAKCQLVTAML